MIIPNRIIGLTVTIIFHYFDCFINGSKTHEGHNLDPTKSPRQSDENVLVSLTEPNKSFRIKEPESLTRILLYARECPILTFMFLRACFGLEPLFLFLFPKCKCNDRSVEYILK